MTTVLAAYAALMTRAAILLLAVAILLILVGAQAAFGQEVISAQPLAQPVSDVPTITLWRDG